MCNIYLLLWMLYSFHWYEVVSTPALNSLSSIFLGFNLALSVYYCVYCLIYYSPPKFYFTVLVLLLLFVVYGLISVLSGEEIYIRALGTKLKNGSYMIGPMRSFLPFFAFYVFYKRGLLTKTSLIVWGAISLVQFVFVFLNSSVEYEVGNFVNNNVYHFTVLLPILFFIRRPRIIQIALLIFLIFMVLLGMKRGAMLVTALFVLYYLYIIIQKASKGRKIAIIVFAVIAIGVGYSYLIRFYESNLVLQRKFESTIEGGSSGRDVLYSQAWNAWSQSNLWQLVFGHGASGSLKVLDNYVHNDWLEILLDMGVVGIITYFVFWVSFIKTWIKSKNNDIIYAVLGGYVFVLLPRSIYGMMYSNLQTIAVMAITYCIALNHDNALLKDRRRTNSKILLKPNNHNTTMISENDNNING